MVEHDNHGTAGSGVELIASTLSTSGAGSRSVVEEADLSTELAERRRMETGAGLDVLPRVAMRRNL